MIRLYKTIDKTKTNKTPARGFWINEAGKVYYDYIDRLLYSNLGKFSLEFLRKKFNQECLFYTQNGQGKIFYTPSKIDVLNKQIKFKVMTTKELRPLLKKLLRQYKGLTVYDCKDLGRCYRYIIEVWTNDQKIELRKKLIHKLVKNLTPDYIRQNINIKVIDRDDISKGFSQMIYKNWQRKKYTLKIDVVSVYNDRVKNGFGNGYYPGRQDKTSFVLNNKRLALRFVILHEIGHIIGRLNNSNTELFADDYAITELESYLEKQINSYEELIGIAIKC